jgi:hypothetical protein
LLFMTIGWACWCCYSSWPRIKQTRASLLSFATFYMFFSECISCFFPRLCAVNYFGSVLSMSFVNSTARLKSSDDDVTFALVVVRSKIQPRFTSP